LDIRRLIDHGPMSGAQMSAVSLCFWLNMLDGVDILAISFAAPLLSRDWGIPATTLGVVLSAALAGMMAGSMLLAPLGDSIGRRKVLVVSLLLISIGMLGATLATSVPELLIARLITGLGIGGVVPTMAAFAAELSPLRRRSFAVTLVQGGYPLGAMFTGLAALVLLPIFGWQALFILGGVLTLLSIPLVFLLLPESPEYLLSKQPPGALANLNKLLRSIGQPELTALPARPAAATEARQNPVGAALQGLASLFRPEYRAATISLWLAFVMSVATLYFLQSWVPQLTANAGLPNSQAYWAGTILNLGAFIGMASVGYLADHFGLRRVIATYLGAGAAVMLLFSLLQTTPAILAGLGTIGLMQGGFIGLYAVSARIYPSAVRVTGIGWAAGVARCGAILGPFVAGLLVAGGMGMTGSFFVFAIPLAIAALAVLSMRSPELSIGSREAARAALEANR
jgi:benzoate transport